MQSQDQQRSDINLNNPLDAYRLSQRIIRGSSSSPNYITPNHRTMQ
jgi:hypothetical protein